MTKPVTFFTAVCAMCVVVVTSNILVQYPCRFLCLEEIVTYGAFVYPLSFLINDLANRNLGQRMACHVVFSGFFTGLIVSWWMTGPRLSIASGSAFLFAQLVDIIVFTLLMGKISWKALLSATVIRSFFDTILFFCVAFSKTFSFIDIITHQPDQSVIAQTQLFKVSIPLWFSWAIGDFFVKIAIAFLTFVPYGTILALM